MRVPSFVAASPAAMMLLAVGVLLSSTMVVQAELTSAFRSDFDEVVLIDGMSSPTDLDVAPDGSDLLLMCEQGGAIYAVTGAAGAADESDITHYEIGDTSSLMCHNGSRGLVGIAFHPDFNSQTSKPGDDTMWVYTYYTAIGKGDCYTGKWDVDELPAREGTINILSRFPLLGDPSSTAKGALEMDMKNEEVLLETAVQMSHNHNGGDIAFGSDGMLYLTLGDGLSNKVKNDKGLPLEQATDALFGKIIRLTPDGNIPEDNPYTPQNGYDNAIFCGRGNDGYSGSSKKPCMEVYASGLRNPFRFAFHPDKNNDDGSPMFYINDVGGSSYERILHARAGANYGYPDVKGPCTEDGCEDPKKHGWDRALHWYEHDSERGACISDGAFIPAAAGWPAEFTGTYLFGEYKLGGIYRISQEPGKGCNFDNCKDPKSPFEDTQVEFSDATATVSLMFGPYLRSGVSSKALYFLTRGAGRGSNEKGRPEGLVRISYNGVAQVANDRPIAAIDTDVRIGFNPLTVTFDGTASSDPDGDDNSLKFAWDLDGDGKIDSTSAKPSFIYKNPGVYTAKLTVTDAGGATDKSSIDITVDNAPPTPIISTPSEDQVEFSVGDSVRLVASATDSEDGALPSSAFLWEIRESHGGFYHTIASKEGNDVTFVMRSPVGREGADTAVVEAIVTATDSRGLSSTATKVLHPKVHAIQVESEPSGLEVMVFGQVVQTPKTLVVWEKQPVTVEALGDKSHEFGSWSDGGADRSNTFIAGLSGSSEIVAYFERTGENVATADSPSVSQSKPKNDMDTNAVNESPGIPSTALVESTPNSITAKLMDFALIISLDADGFRRKLREKKKSPLYPYLNDNLQDLVSEWLVAELKQVVKSSGLPYAKPIEIELERKSKKGHDDGSRYEAVFGGTITYKKKKEGQHLPSIAAIQEMQEQVLSRVGDDLVDEIHSNTPELGYLITSIVTDVVYPESTGSVSDSEVAMNSQEKEGGDGNKRAVVLGVCFGVAGIGIVAIAAFFIVRRRSDNRKKSDAKIPPPPAPKSDLNLTGETEYNGYDL